MAERTFDEFMSDLLSDFSLDELATMNMTTRLRDDQRPHAQGIGATTTGAYARSKTRRLFLDALHNVAPHVMAALVTEEALGLIRSLDSLTAQQERDRRRLEHDWSTASSTEAKHAAFDAYLSSAARQEDNPPWNQLSRHIESWQRAHNLAEPWIADAARMTLWLAAQHQATGSAFDGPYALGEADLTATPLDVTGVDSDSRGIPVSLDSLKMLDREFGGEGLLGFFNPRMETVDAGVERLLHSIEVRVRMLLQLHVIGDVRAGNAIPTPGEMRTNRAFEWLVRYQVLEESRNEIARMDQVDRSNVGREVKKAADLVGLEPRMETGGRPRRRRGSHTKRVR